MDMIYEYKLYFSFLHTTTGKAKIILKLLMLEYYM